MMSSPICWMCITTPRWRQPSASWRITAVCMRRRSGTARKDRTLPVIAPWDFGWETGEGPETGDIGDVTYLMNTAHALQLAMGNEQRAHDFYDQISRESRDVEVAALAAEFAAEEKEHLDLLQAWMNKTDASVDEQFYDPDPPHMPE